MQAVAREIGRYGFRFVLSSGSASRFPSQSTWSPCRSSSSNTRTASLDERCSQKYGEGYSWIAREKNDACTWVAGRVLHVEVIIKMTGSGDTMRSMSAAFVRLSSPPLPPSYGPPSRCSCTGGNLTGIPTAGLTR